MTEEIRIPQYADDPPQILIFSMEEFFIIMMFMVVGTLFNLMLPAMLVGMGMGKLFKKVQEGAMPGLLYHMLWWIGLVSFKGKFSTGLIREIYFL